MKQIGHAILHLEKYKEDFLIPLPDVKVKGVFSGTTYPEIDGEYHIMSSSRYVSEMDFSGKKWLGSGKKNSVHAVLYQQEPKGDRKNPLFTVTGQWNEILTIHLGGDHGPVIETLNIPTLTSVPLESEPLAEQDPWESRKAWAGVIAALNKGDMSGTAHEKSILEEAQREMRKAEEAKGTHWEPLFFSRLQTSRDPLVEDLAAEPVREGLFSPRSGMWRFDGQKWERGVRKPFHGHVKPSLGKI